MKIRISQSQLKSIIKEQTVDSAYSATPEERFNNNPDKYWDVYAAATDQQITQIDKDIFTPCYNKQKGGYYTIKNCQEIRDYDSTSIARIFSNGRIFVQDKNTLKLKKKGTMVLKDIDHFRINWDDGSSLEKKADPNWTYGKHKTTNTTSNCATSFDQLKQGSGKLLQKGCKSDIVKQIQTMLGMEQRYQTGFFGDITKNKVIEFQKTHKDSNGTNLKPDGIVGEKTYGALKTS